jgi:uncharacterized protein
MAEVVTADAPRLARPRVMRQAWLNLAFLHWAVEPASVAHLLPSGIAPDTIDGRSYVGLVSFQMADTGFPHGPALFGTFLETNVRLYSIDHTGRRGVVFLSLDCDRLAFVAGARTAVGVPYRWARMRYRQDGDRHAYSLTVRRPWPTVSSSVEVDVGESLPPGPLEHFLTARWGLHIRRFGRTWYMPNEHPAWTLRAAELVSFVDEGHLASVGLADLGKHQPDHVAFSEGVPAWFGRPAAASRPRRSDR